jgi:hypothetical protein
MPNLRASSISVPRFRGERGDIAAELKGGRPLRYVIIVHRPGRNRTN